MNRFARLLLDIKIDLRFFLELFDAVCSILRKHSGTFANIEGVTFGSSKIIPVRSEEVFIPHLPHQLIPY